jgi:glutamate transport system substrate-binding protein
MRRYLMVAVVSLALLAAPACGNEAKDSSGGGAAPPPSFAAGTTMAALQQKGKITVGTKFDQPLFGNKTLSDQPEGFDVEIAKIIAKGIFGDNIDGKVTFEEAQSKVREEYIQQGRVDYVVATYTINDTRKQVVSFAGPYYIAGQDLLVKKDNTAITGVDSLAGKKVCSVSGSTSLTNVQKAAPQADTSLVFDTYSKCVEALKDGRVEAVTTDDVILLGYVAQDKEKLKVVGKPFSKEPYGIGLKKDDKVFRDFINDQLEKSYANGTWAKAFADQVGSKTGVAVPTPPPVERY